MRAVGPAVVEIRIHVGNEYRIFFLASVQDAVHVLHAFVKKTQKTRQSDIRLAASRYREAVAE